MRYLIADKGYDANDLRRSLRERGTMPVIPGRRRRKRAIRYDKQRYPPTSPPALCRSRWSRPARRSIASIAAISAQCISARPA